MSWSLHLKEVSLLCSSSQICCVEHDDGNVHPQHPVGDKAGDVSTQWLSGTPHLHVGAAGSQPVPLGCVLPEVKSLLVLAGWFYSGDPHAGLHRPADALLLLHRPPLAKGNT